jgi:hypothetical protein
MFDVIAYTLDIYLANPVINFSRLASPSSSTTSLSQDAMTQKLMEYSLIAAMVSMRAVLQWSHQVSV